MRLFLRRMIMRLTDKKGDADGLGETRKKELTKSAITLGLRQEEDVYVVESPYVHLILKQKTDTEIPQRLPR